MTAKYHLIVHPELRDQLRALHQAAQRNPGGPEAQQFEEFEGPEPGHLPVRQVVAFEPRRDGRPFDVTADRLERSKGVPLAELNSIPTVRPATGPGKDAGRPVGPARQPLPPDLAQAMRAALEGNAPASGAVNAQRGDNNRPRPKGASPEGPFKGR